MARSRTGIDQLGLLAALDISNNQLNDTDIPDFRIRGARLWRSCSCSAINCLQTSDLANYNYILARDPAWNNCGQPAPPPPPGP